MHTMVGLPFRCSTCIPLTHKPQQTDVLDCERAEQTRCDKARRCQKEVGRLLKEKSLIRIPSPIGPWTAAGKDTLTLVHGLCSLLV